MQQVSTALSSHYRDTLLGTWAIYIPVQVVNFAVVPLPMRVPIAYAADVVCCALYSHLSHRPAAPDETGEAADARRRDSR